MHSMINDTELRLSFWRSGSTQAERLAASALRLSGYEEIDPQSPLGGPDGKKDSQTAKALATNTRELLALRASIERIQTDQSQLALRASIERIQTDQSHLMRTIGLAMSAGVATLDLISVSSFQKADDLPAISAGLGSMLLVLNCSGELPIDCRIDSIGLRQGPLAPFFRLLDRMGFVA